MQSRQYVGVRLMKNATFARFSWFSIRSIARSSSPVKTGWSLSLILLLAIAFAGSFAYASSIDDDDAPEAASPAAANARAVRLSYMDGSVRVTQGDQVIADPAVVNMPLFEGSEVSTAGDGRAEIQMEDGSIVRLSPNTTLIFSVMQLQGTAPRTEITLSGGLAYFELQPSNAEHRMRVRYGDASFTASEFSIIRLTSDTPPAELAVLSGNIRLERASALQIDVHAGESLTLDANDQSRYNLISSITPNSWDNWNADRDQFLSTEASDRTAASGDLKDYPGDGMSDLDANGNWYNVPGQGYVWSPYEAQDAGAGWDPYGYGNWIYYPQYGYIWASGYTWGYSPFQCGLWDYYEDFGWAWAPGYGCSPWWGYGGGGGWIYRIGNNRPPGYHPPRRPHPPTGPGKPRPRDPVYHGPGRMPANPIIAVDRRPGGGGVVPVEHNGSVTIAGHPVEPLRPIAPRQGFRTGNSEDNNNANPPGQGFVVQHAPGTGPAPVVPGKNPRTIYTPQPIHPVTGSPGSHPVTPVAPRPMPMPARPAPMRPVSPPPAQRMAPPPPPPHFSPPASTHK
jgi:hypothetical protein